MKAVRWGSIINRKASLTFIHDLLAADGKTGQEKRRFPTSKVQDGEFGWSVSRQKLFNFFDQSVDCVRLRE